MGSIRQYPSLGRGSWKLEMTFLFPLFVAILIGSLQANEEPPEEEENIGGSTALTRSTRFSFGLGKRSSDISSFPCLCVQDHDVSHYEGEPSELVLGLLGPGKRGYGFGLGKRDRQFGFGLGKRGQQYGFGLGKREGSFGFGLGKRDYGFGLGKRDGQQFGFGLGKRD